MIAIVAACGRCALAVHYAVFEGIEGVSHGADLEAFVVLGDLRYRVSILDDDERGKESAYLITHSKPPIIVRRSPQVRHKSHIGQVHQVQPPI